MGKKFKYIDGFVVNFARNEGLLPIEVVKGNLYIKFTKERISDLNRRTANCTICSVFDGDKNIINKQIVLNELVS